MHRDQLFNSGAWLRQQREARRWTRLEMARQLIQAGRAKGDTLPGADSMCHNIHRWEAARAASPNVTNCSTAPS